MSFDAELDAKGLNCPLPILRAKKAITALSLHYLQVRYWKLSQLIRVLLKISKHSATKQVTSCCQALKPVVLLNLWLKSL